MWHPLRAEWRGCSAEVLGMGSLTMHGAARLAANKLSTDRNRAAAVAAQYADWLGSKASVSAAIDALTSASESSKYPARVLALADLFYDSFDDYPEESSLPQGGSAGQVLGVTESGNDWIDLPEAQQLFRGEWTAQSVALIPDMTNYTVPAPYIVSASSQSNPSYYVFDKSVSYWQVGVSQNPPSVANPYWVQVDMGTSHKVTRYDVTCYTVDRAPKDWELQGSPDGDTWTVLDSQVGITFSTNQEVKGFACTPASFRYLRFNITQYGGNTSYLAVGELQYWEDQDKPYMGGEFVTYGGKMWESLVDNNPDVPGDPGALWKETLDLPAKSGATANRPSASAVGVGYPFFDTTLGKPIWSNGTGWVDATGAAV